MDGGSSLFMAHIESPWKRCLELAWDAFVAGSVPVGSVLTDSFGIHVVEARNRSQDWPPNAESFDGSLISHAEVNVLASLAPGDYSDHVLWSSVEPCFMCTGAALHSRVGTIRFAAADPVISGMGDLPNISSWIRERWPDRQGPVDGLVADISTLLTSLWHVRNDKKNLIEHIAEEDPVLFGLAETLAQHAPPATLSEALDPYWDALT